MRKERIEKSQYKDLINIAIEQTKNAYVPYSRFHVGAALLDVNGKIWTGCNIESASYTPTNCAERTAIFKAVSEGTKEFKAIAIVGKDGDHEQITKDFTAPCGVCRQVLAEFCNDDFEIILANSNGEVVIYTMDEILPLRFTKESIDNAR